MINLVLSPKAAPAASLPAPADVESNHEIMERERAATRIQTMTRGRQSRKRAKTLVLALHAKNRLRGKGSESFLMQRPLSDVRFYVAPVKELQVEIVEADAPAASMLHYRVVGDAAAISLLNRLSKPNESSSTIIGILSPLTPVTLGPEAKLAAGIPVNAAYFAFAYPLECLAASSKTLIETVIGSVSRLDDELFFFFLLGGFCYFDERKTFVQANAISLKPSPGELRFGGPFPISAKASKLLKESARLRPLHIASLNDAGLRSFGWVNPGESLGPSDEPLHESVDWQHGAFVYQRDDGQASACRARI